jgi:selenocysteine-specific translation elongation factor
MHDKNVEESYSPARVGLALTGVSFDELTRGDILSNVNHFTSADQELIMNFNKVPFYKNDLSENNSYLLSIRTQIRACKDREIREQ